MDGGEETRGGWCVMKKIFLDFSFWGKKQEVSTNMSR